jgi:nucleoside-diphosphate-sugar epimerase
MLTHTVPSPIAPARVVILGANGFVARALRLELERAGIVTLALGSADLDLTEAQAAGKLAALLRPQDALVVTAALTPDKGKDLATLLKNLRMIEAVVAALAAQPCAHVVYFSSDAVYDDSVALVDERTTAAPKDLYGLMHLTREIALQQACLKPAIPLGVVRPSAIYGAGDTHNSYGPNRFVRSALAEGRIRLFGQGEETRDHVAIADVVALTSLVLRHRSAGVLNAVSGEAITFAALATHISQLAGRSVTIEPLPRGGPVTHRRFDVTRRQRAFPTFRPTPLADGLASLLRETEKR